MKILCACLGLALMGCHEMVPTPAAAWKLSWSDEFDGPAGQAPNAAHWTIRTGGNGWGNGELESYTTRKENVRLDGQGNLILEARKEKFTGTDGIPRDYTSGRIDTQDKFSKTFGRFEARIKVPFGQGMWPAFWMIGDKIKAVSWPACGEVDIMEHLGRESSISHSTMHGPGYFAAQAIGAQYTLPWGQRFSDDFHVFALEWEPRVLRWYIDGKLFQTRTPKDLKGKKWVFDSPFFILLNLAVGGGWPGAPDAATRFPQQMLVDYVRVYQAP